MVKINQHTLGTKGTIDKSLAMKYNPVLQTKQ